MKNEKINLGYKLSNLMGKQEINSKEYKLLYEGLFKEEIENKPLEKRIININLFLEDVKKAQDKMKKTQDRINKDPELTKDQKLDRLLYIMLSNDADNWILKNQSKEEKKP